MVKIALEKEVNFEIERMYTQLNIKQEEENQNWLKAYELMKTKLEDMEKENILMKAMMKEGTETLEKNIIEGEIHKKVPLNSSKPPLLWRKGTHYTVSCPKCEQNIGYSEIFKHLVKVHETDHVSLPCEMCNRQVTANGIMVHMTNTCVGSIVL